MISPTVPSKSSASFCMSALRRARRDLRLRLLGLQHEAGGRVSLEDFDGLSHLADLVALADAGYLNVELAAGEFLHCVRHLPQRPGNAAGDDVIDTVSVISSTSPAINRARFEAQVCALRSSI